MIKILLMIALIAYSIWAIRHIYLKKKYKTKCSDCPYKDSEFFQ